MSARRLAGLSNADLLGELRAGIGQAPESELLAAAETLEHIAGHATTGPAETAYDWRALTVRQPWAAAIVHGPKPWWRGGCCAPWGESGPDSESAWHWVLTGRRALRKPVPARGALGFWRPSPGVLAAVLDQIEGAW